jgi:phage gpG-like protein
MSKLGIDKSLSKFENIKFQLPKIIANDGVRFFLKGFRSQGFTDEVFTRWKSRKGVQKGRDATRNILVDSGALRRSVSNSVKVATWDKIKFQVELPYAAYLNNGTDKMPQRKFMGDSKKLTQENIKKIKEVIGSIWQG